MKRRDFIRKSAVGFGALAAGFLGVEKKSKSTQKKTLAKKEFCKAYSIILPTAIYTIPLSSGKGGALTVFNENHFPIKISLGTSKGKLVVPQYSQRRIDSFPHGISYITIYGKRGADISIIKEPAGGRRL